MLLRFASILLAVFALACGQSDTGITAQVKTRIAADNVARAYDIDVTTRNRVVTLSGTVATSAAKEQAIQIARATDGVREVVDELRVSESAATSGVLDDPDPGTEERGSAGGTARDVLADPAITSMVKAKLLGDTAVSGLAIDVDTTDGVVTLTGAANTRAEADRAIQLAGQTEGVKRVVDKLKVAR